MGRVCGLVRLSPKDVVVGLCGCGSQALIFTFVIGINTLFSDWQTSFDSDRGSTASVQAVCLGLTTGGGLISGIVDRKLGTRRTMLLGSFLSTVGFFAGGFATTLPVLTVCVGIIAGSGFSLIFLCNMSFVLQWFSRRAGVMSSALSLASALAMVASPFLIRELTDTFTWRGCLLLASALALHSSILSLLLTSPLLQTASPPAGTPASPSSPAAGSSEAETCPQGAGPAPAPQRAPRGGQRGTDSAPRAAGAGRSATSVTSDPASQSAVVTRTAAENTACPSPDLPSPSTTPARVSGARDCGADDLDLPSDSSHAGDVAQESGPVSSVTPSSPRECTTPGVDSSHAEADGDSSDKRIVGQDAVNENRSSTHRKNSGSSQDPDGDVLSEGEDESPENPGGDTHPVSNVEESLAKMPRSRLRKCIRQVKFLADPLYITVVLAVGLNIAIGSAFIVLVLDYTKYHGWTQEDGLFLNFLFMVTNVISRVVVLVISFHRKVHSVILVVFAGVIGGVSAFLLGHDCWWTFKDPTALSPLCTESSFSWQILFSSSSSNVARLPLLPGILEMHTIQIRKGKERKLRRKWTGNGRHTFK